MIAHGGNGKGNNSGGTGYAGDSYSIINGNPLGGCYPLPTLLDCSNQELISELYRRNLVNKQAFEKLFKEQEISNLEIQIENTKKRLEELKKGDSK